MPYEVKVSAACPMDKRYGVWKDGQLLGCHPSEDNAGEQVQALYASERIERAKYDGIDFTPPEGAREEAQKGLDWRKEFGRGGTPVGWARARDIANGESLSPDTINRMVSYFARHEVDKQGEGWSPGEKGFPSAGRIAWALWGGDAGKSWSAKVKRQMDARDSEKVERRSGMETIQRQFGAVKDGRAVIATETPIEIYDQSRGWIKQVLLMDGVVFRNGKKQLPIVDSHNDKTVRNVFGSIRNISIEGDQLIGDPDFASDAESQIVRTRFDEGHLTDFSIDAVILERQLIPQGQSYTTTSGQVIDGPAEIVTRWEPHNASICATGADPNSTVRRSYDREGVTRMDESLMAKLQMLGLPEGMTDAAEIIAWMAEKMPEPSVEVELMEGEKPAEEVAERAEHTDDEMKVEKMEEIKAEVERQLKAEKVRRQTILNHCKLAKLERSFADSLIEDETVTVEIAQERIIRAMAQQPLGAVTGSNLRVTESEQDKFEAAASAGLVQRCFQGGGIKRSKPDQVQGQEHFANLGLYRLAEACVRRMGINPEKFNRQDVARMAMGHQPTFDRLRVQRANEAYHTTGSFANLLLDAANKTLRAAYEEAPYTWSLWARQAASVADFKNINRVQIGESGNLEMVPETKQYPEKSVGDTKRTYQIAKYGAEFKVSWETVVNDDLDALSRIPAMQGNAARRTQEKVVYDALLSNPTMPDTYALFSASHPSGSNISGSAAAPSVSTLSDGFEAMGLQKGLSSDVYLNLVPRTLLVPLNYSATALEIVNSQSYAASNNNSGVVNIYGVNGVRPLQVVATPLLDANSATNWYLIADNAQIDTVEITFLQGEESPVLENEWVMSNDVYRYKVRQSFAAAVIDHRGIYGNR
jgi:hypothetical protein